MVPAPTRLTWGYVNRCSDATEDGGCVNAIDIGYVIRALGESENAGAATAIRVIANEWSRTKLPQGVDLLLQLLARRILPAAEDRVVP